MRVLAAFAALFAVGKADEVSDPDVHVLTKDSFDDFVNTNKYVLAEFYAPWCGHCKKLAPEYAAAATALKNSESEVKLAKIDATAEKELGERFGVSGYPSLFWFVDGEKKEYTGGRTEAEILAWINRKTSDPYTTGDDIPEVGAKSLVLLKAHKLLDEFVKLADSLGDDMNFHYVHVADSKAPHVSIQHKGEGAIEASESDLENLKGFIDANVLPKFGALDGASYQKYMASGKGLVWLMLPIESSADLGDKIDEVRKEFTELSAKFPGFKFVYIDTIMFAKAIESMFEVKEFPALVVHKKAGDKKKFVLQGDDATDVSKVADYISDVVSGKIQAVLKSEDVPENDDHPVKTIVGSTMESELFQAEKDILFEVYAPWCGHCKKLAPELDMLASKIRADGLEDLIRITKMDGTANDSPIEAITWEGFPTMFYIKAGTNKAVPFNGGRDAKSIWKWIKANHSSHSVLAERVAAAKAAKEAAGHEDDGKDEL